METSNISKIKEDKLTNQAIVTKEIIYTLSKAEQAIDNIQNKPDAVMLHCLTNEIKNNLPQISV